MKSNIKIGSYSVSTYNLGDHLQIVAQVNLLQKMGLTPQLYIDRDHEIHSCQKLDNLGDNKLFLVMNGWHKKNEHEWPPSEKIIPLFIGFHIRNTMPQAWPSATSIENIKYFKGKEPIGCRDRYTYNLLQTYGVDSYESNCLTLAFDKRKKKDTQTKIFVSSRNRDILKILPRSIFKKCEYVNHYSQTNDFCENMKRAQNLLNNYRNHAKLVVTTFLHCALPCIAMGIPVIVFYPNHGKNLLRRVFSSQYAKNAKLNHKSDRQRFSTLETIIKCYQFSEVRNVNWNPCIVNIDNLKEKIIADFQRRVKVALSE